MLDVAASLPSSAVHCQLNGFSHQQMSSEEAEPMSETVNKSLE